jgi:non-ribosomal peptide synthase protein (TIGR01720 family)
VNEILLTALMQTFGRWTGSAALLLDFEGQGREVAFPATDLSRTVGWFTTVFPMVLELVPGSGQEEALKAIKEQMRRLPREGLGYGALRYLRNDQDIAPQLRTQPRAQVFFYYLGHQAIGTMDLFGYTGELLERSRTMRGSAHALLEIRTVIVEGQLQAIWSYSERLHQPATIERLCGEFLADIRAIIAHCQSADTEGLTPSDFPDADVSQSELDDVLAEFSDFIK